MLGINVFMLNLMINLMDDFMTRINDEEGDAFPFEKAKIIAELELMMPAEYLDNPDFFPKWVHLLKAKGEGRGEDVDEWQGTVQAIRSETAGLDRKTRGHLRELRGGLEVSRRHSARLPPLPPPVPTGVSGNRANVAVGCGTACGSAESWAAPPLPAVARGGLGVRRV